MDTVIPVAGGPTVAAAPNTAPVSHRSSRQAGTAAALVAWLRGFGFTDPVLLARTVDRLLADPALPADGPAAVAHAERRAAAWFAAVLGEDLAPAGRAAVAGRAAFLLADAARRWPDDFLGEGEPPAALVTALRRDVPVAAPEPVPGAMADQSLDWTSPVDLVRRLFARPERKALQRSA